MPNIKPISELRNNFNDVASLCRESGKPVFITRNGYGDLVLMSIDAYEEQQARLELYQKLEAADAQLAEGAAPLTHEEVFGRLKEKYVPRE